MLVKYDSLTLRPEKSTATILNSPSAFYDGQWHHAAVVRRGSELLLFVDGKIVATATDSRSLSGQLRLALGQHNNTDFFTGLLDEVVYLAGGVGRLGGIQPVYRWQSGRLRLDQRYGE